SGGPESNAIGGVDYADIARAADPDAVAGQKVHVFLNAALEILAKPLDVFLEPVVGLVLQAAYAEGVRGQARAAVFFEDLQDLLALAQAVEERCKRADIQCMCAEPDKVTGNAL